jgi:hypothetical protein
MCSQKHKTLERAAKSCAFLFFWVTVVGEESANGKKRASNQLLEDLLNTCLCVNQQIALA